MALRRSVAAADAVLLDFDGPMCKLFAGVSDLTVARRMRAVVPRDIDVPSTLGPHQLLTFIHREAPDAVDAAEAVLAADETAAAETARPTPGAADLLDACQRTGRTVAIASNNSATAVQRYLALHGLIDHIAHVEGRDPTDPALMKPSPYVLTHALAAIAAPPASSLFIGDSTSDVTAARAADVPFIGYANKNGKAAALQAAGAADVVTTLGEIVDAIREH